MTRVYCQLRTEELEDRCTPSIGITDGHVVVANSLTRISDGQSVSSDAAISSSDFNLYPPESSAGNQLASLSLGWYLPPYDKLSASNGVFSAVESQDSYGSFSVDAGLRFSGSDNWDATMRTDRPINFSLLPVPGYGEGDLVRVDVSNGTGVGVGIGEGHDPVSGLSIAFFASADDGSGAKVLLDGTYFGKYPLDSVFSQNRALDMTFGESVDLSFSLRGRGVATSDAYGYLSVGISVTVPRADYTVTAGSLRSLDDGKRVVDVSTSLNQYLTSATGTVPLSFYWANGPTLADRIGSSVYQVNLASTPYSDAKQSVDLNLMGLRPAGATHVIAIADPDGQLEEPDESNNFTAIEVPKENYSILGWNWNSRRGPAYGTSSQRGLNFTVEGDGENGSNGPVDVGFYWAKGDPKHPATSDRLSGLLSTKTVFVSRYYSENTNEPAYWGQSPADANYIQIAVDPDDTIQESDEGDNLRGVPIHSRAEILNGSVSITHPDTTDPDTGATIPGKYNIRAVFEPGKSVPDGPLSLSEAEVILGVDHFNWLQEISLPSNWTIYKTTAFSGAILKDAVFGTILDPIVSPDGAYYSYDISAPSGSVPPFSGFVAKSRTFDAYDPYLDEDTKSEWQFYDPANGGGTKSSSAFEFDDTPNFDRRAFSPDYLDEPPHVRFATMLIGVDKNHRVVKLLSGEMLDAARIEFNWRSNTVHDDSGTIVGGSIFRPVRASADTLPVPSGGGIFAVAYSDGIAVPGFPVDAPSFGYPPTVTTLSDLSIIEGGATGPLYFTVADAETAAGVLNVQAISSNADLLPTANIILAGVGSERSLVATPISGKTGFSTVTVAVTDSEGRTTTSSFVLTVLPLQHNTYHLVGYSNAAAGADRGSGAVTLFNPDGSVRFTIDPFPGFTGGVRTAGADFNGDGVADIVAGTGPGRATRVVILDGVTKAELFAVDPFEAAFTGGVYVTAGDLNGDGKPDLVITPDEGGGPRVDIYSGSGFGKLASFFGIDDPNFRGGARASTGDMTGDGRADLIVVAGFGGGPRVAGFNGTSLGGTPSRIFGDFFAFEQSLRNGIFVTVGDLDGDGNADLIAGGGPGGGPRVLAFGGKGLTNGNQLNQLANFFGGDPNSRGGIRLAVKDLDGDARADLVVGAGAGAGSRVTSYLGKSIPTDGPPAENYAFDSFAGFTGGVFVG